MPADYRQQVYAYLPNSLKDPYSVRDAEISAPTVVFVGLVNGGNAPGACVRLNAKNSLDAYTDVRHSPSRSATAKLSALDTCSKGASRPFQEITERAKSERAWLLNGLSWWSRAGSNRRPPQCDCGALPAELRPHRINNTHHFIRVAMRRKVQSSNPCQIMP